MHGVTTYQMSEEEQEALQKKTPGYYIQKREEGLKDKEIAAEMGIKPSQLSMMKGRWDFVGKSLEEMKKKVNYNKRKQKGEKTAPRNMSDDIKEDVEVAEEKKETDEQSDQMEDFKKHIESLKQERDQYKKLYEENYQVKTVPEQKLEDEQSATDQWQNKHKEEVAYWKNKYYELEKTYQIEVINNNQDQENDVQKVRTLQAEIQRLQSVVEDIEKENQRLQQNSDIYRNELMTYKKKTHHLHEFVKLG